MSNVERLLPVPGWSQDGFTVFSRIRTSVSIVGTIGLVGTMKEGLETGVMNLWPFGRVFIDRIPGVDELRQGERVWSPVGGLMRKGDEVIDVNTGKVISSKQIY